MSEKLNPVFEHPGRCVICEADVTFTAQYAWFRDHLKCPGCGSIPRERALMYVIQTFYPHWRDLRIHEMAPVGRGASIKLGEAAGYEASQYFPTLPLGERTPPGWMNQDAEKLTCADRAFDLVVTQDVFEHIFDIDAAFREIRRTLRPGGAHVFTTPLVKKAQPTECRASRTADGSIRHHAEAGVSRQSGGPAGIAGDVALRLRPRRPHPGAHADAHRHPPVRPAGPGHPGRAHRRADEPETRRRRRRPGRFVFVSMTRRKLPIGIQTFRKIREGRCYYVDKTAYIRQLLDEGEHYFLSRPRRFGKSLFLDTCKELFEGNEPLFAGLAIHDRWDWSVRHPVLRLSFGSGNFKELVSSTELLSTFDVDGMPTEALLFQTGYLTIERPQPRGGRMFYRLGYPNREVRQSLNQSLLNRMTGDASRPVAHSVRLYDLLLINDFTGLAALFESFFASIPYEWYTNNDIASYEGFYASVFYSYFAGLGLDVVVEDSSSHGRSDMALRFNDNVYLFEFKVVELAPEGAAIAQLKAKGYADKYHDRGEPIHLIGVEFSQEARNLAAFDVQQAS